MDKSLAKALAEARETGVFSAPHMGLTTLPKEIRNLDGLRELRLAECEIRELPHWLDELPLLTCVDLALNPLRTVPPVLGRLHALTELSLSQTELYGGLDRSLASLSHLKVLALPGNRLTEVPAWIGELHRLQALDLGGNPIRTIPRTFGQLSELRYLYMWGHGLDEVPDVLSELSHLEVLDLSRTGSQELPEGMSQETPDWFRVFHLVGAGNGSAAFLNTLPDRLAERLPALRKLYVGGQGLSSLPTELPSGLWGLYAAFNELGSVPTAILSLSHLEHLDLRGNSIHDLPLGLAAMRLSYLDLAENPSLPIPPEILSDPDNPDAILDFIRRIQGSTRRLDQAKLLVVGEGAVGKTSLVRQLLTGEFSASEPKTEGIDVTRWVVSVDRDPITLNVWDFGGQEIMHATHQFFLTRRSIYLLVLDARQADEQNRLEYWLKLIQSFSGASPVIVVGNKTDQQPLDIDGRGLRSKYPNILTIVPASCQTGFGIQEVEEAIVRALTGLSHVRDPLPEAFFEIKRELENLDVNYLPYSDYEHLCVQYGIEGSSEQELLIGFLHDLGTVLCFRDDPRLSDTNILNPAWVTSGVYRLLNSHLAAQRKGLLRWADINSALNSPEFPADRRPFLVDMMKKFELCYESDGTFLVADLLTKEEPDTGNWDGALQFAIQYDVLPSSVISRLIVRMNASISHGTVWRAGVVVAMDGNRALVRGDQEDGLIHVAIDGPPAGRRGLLSAIRSQLREIEATIPGLSVEERVPVPGHVGVWVPYKHLVDLDNAGRDTVVPQGLTDDFVIRDLLAGVEMPSARVERRPTNIRSRPRAVSAADEAAVWQPDESIRLGRFLLWALVVCVAVFVGAYRLLGAGAALVITAAVAAVVGIALFVLRAAGRLSERGLLKGLRRVLYRGDGGAHP